MDQLLETTAITPAANDNAALDAVVSLKSALDNFLTKKQVQDIVQREISDFHCTHTIELKQGDTMTTLPEKPRHKLFPDILKVTSLDMPAALIGPAGSGKSTCCEQVAEALKLPFYLQNGVTGTHELTGYMDAHGRYQGTPFRTCFTEGGLFFVDEVDTSDAGALKWLNTALANGHAVFPDQASPVSRHIDFRIIIAANTYGTGADRLYVGANQLDASTLDRFVFFEFEYDEKLEVIVAGNPTWVKRVQQLRKAAWKEKARVVISPRASIYGAKLLAAGVSQSTVEKQVIWKGMDEELKSRILKAA